MKRRFVEATRFTTERERMEHAGELTHDDLVALEQAILANPEAGDLVPGTGGFRKIRIAQRAVSRGKRGGARVYYLDLPRAQVTHLLAVYGKRQQVDLSAAERRALAAVAKLLKEET